MSDSKKSSDHNRHLFELEVKNTIRRVAELTATIDEFKLEAASRSIDLEPYDELLEAVEQQALQIEQLVSESERYQNRLEYQSSEISMLKAAIRRQGVLIEDLRRRVDEPVASYGKTPVYGIPAFEAITEVNWPPQA